MLVSTATITAVTPFGVVDPFACFPRVGEAPTLGYWRTLVRGRIRVPTPITNIHHDAAL